MKFPGKLLALFVCLAASPLLAQPQPAALVLFYPFGAPPEGSRITQRLFLGMDNVLYGTTLQGGSNLCGTVFKINRDGTGYALLHHFTTNDNNATVNPINGAGPMVIQGHDGALYGTCPGGSQFSTYPDGLVFKMNTDGSGYTVLHSFISGEGAPQNLVQGPDEMLYGAGAAVFKMDTTGGNYSVLHTFTNSTDGSLPVGKLRYGSDGVLYGVAALGGTNGSFGTLYKLNTDGLGFSLLHTFGASADDGRRPYCQLIEGVDGALYGTTRLGGTNNIGTVFKINRNGTGYQILHYFQTNSVDGAVPYGGLVQGLDNFMYGTTQQGGTNSNNGTIFRIAPDGSGYQILSHMRAYSGTNSYNLNAPYAGLVQGPGSDGAGVLYGGTYDGPTANGSIYAIIVNPPVAITPAAGQSGSQTVVFWPAWALNYQLQTSTNVSGPWVTASNYMPITGAQLTNSPPNSFYRLVYPQ